MYVKLDEKMARLVKSLKVDSYYKVLEETRLSYKIKSDSGIIDSYPKEWFEDKK